MREDALFRIASMTKPITSIAFMQLVEQCKIALDDPVARVLAELADLGTYAGGGAGYRSRRQSAGCQCALST